MTSQWRSFYCPRLKQRIDSGYLQSVKQWKGRCNADTSTTVLRRGGFFVSPFPIPLTLSDVIQPTLTDYERSPLHVPTHRNIVTCTQYAYRKSGSATFRHLRINAVISSTLGNSLLARQLRLLLTSLRSRAEALLDCCACQSKPIYEYFFAENTRYVFRRR